MSIIARALLITFVVSGGGCAYFAVMSAPKKQATITRSEAAIAADEFFWQQFHHGNFHRIDEILLRLKGAFLKDPSDWQLAAHLGFTHIWRFSEHSRLEKLMPTIVDDAKLSLWYFEEAQKLNPSDARIHGFIADLKMALGTIYHDERLTREGYYDGLASIKRWPEFNLFTVGFGMSTLRHDSKEFQEALSWQWETLDRCSGTRIDRKNPDYQRFMSKAEHDMTIRKKSVCWNSWIAPHNFEGFFLNMGDMLVKSGDVKTAQAIYRNAMLSPTYADWPYATILAERIRNAAKNVEEFRKEASTNPIMLSSKFSCMACHQAQK